MRTNFSAVSLLSALFLAAPGLSLAKNATPSQQSTAKEITIDQDGYRFEVKLDPAKKKVTVNSLGVEEKLPQQMSLSLFRDESTGQTVDLMAVPPPKPGETPSYQGKIDWYSGPYVAFELQIPLPNHTWKRIRKPLPGESK